MTQENIDVIRRLFLAFNSEDIDRMLALVDPDFEVEVPPRLSAEPDVYRGHAGIRRYFESFREAMQQIRFEAERVWDAGDDVVVLMHISAQGKRTQIAVEQHNPTVWTVSDGKARRARMYASLDEALDSVGLCHISETP